MHTLYLIQCLGDTSLVFGKICCEDTACIHCTSSKCLGDTSLVFGKICCEDTAAYTVPHPMLRRYLTGVW